MQTGERPEKSCRRIVDAESVSVSLLPEKLLHLAFSFNNNSEGLGQE